MRVNRFLIHGKNFFTIQDLMDEVGHEIERIRETPRTEEVAVLRMFKSDLRNLVKRYERIQSIIEGGKDE